MAATATAHLDSPHDATPGTCDRQSVRAHVHRAHVRVKAAYSLDRWADGPKRSALRDFQRQKKCVYVPTARFALHQLRLKLSKRFDAYRRERLEITPFAGPSGTYWAVPYGIVACESGGDFRARNSISSAGGAYQILDTTWYANGGTHYADSHPAAVAPPDEQHEVAHRVWVTSGAGAWSCSS